MVSASWLLMKAAKATTSSAARILPSNPADASLPAPTGAASVDQDDDMNLAGIDIGVPRIMSFVLTCGLQGNTQDAK